MPQAHWLPEDANGEDFLFVPIGFAQVYKKFRDKYAPGTEMWVTESGDAGGGDTWASTYLDVLRTLNELGGFSKETRGVIFHNTLAGKDGNKRATVMTLNGRDLVLGENNELPDLSGAPVAAGTIELAPMTCTFLVV